MEKYERLFSPIQINSIEIKNRLSMPAMFTKFANPDGSINERIVEYLEARAKGGVGMIVLENTCVDWEYGRANGNPITIHKDSYIPGLYELVIELQKYGVKVFPELHHVGREQMSKYLDGNQPWGPSAVACEGGYDIPKVMTEDDIEYAINKYVDAAIRSKQAGFDGVYIHGAHGYLPYAFLSPKSNKRTDRWGGSLNNRSRFAVELVKRVRNVVGAGYPIIFRFSGEEWVEGGLELAEGVVFAQYLEEAGADALDVSGGGYESIVGSPMQGQAFDSMIYMAEAVKKHVGIPVFGTGSMGMYPALCEQLIADGKVDMLNFGRSLLADPELPNKMKQGREDEIRHCIRCNECLGALDENQGIRCAINPQLGREYKDKVILADKKKNIVIVGAGPCGMQYAITSSERGHEVTIMEKSDRIGGLAFIAGISNYKQKELWSLCQYYKTIAYKRGINVLLNTDASLDIIQTYNPDKVILTTGAEPMELNVPGAQKAANALDVLENDGNGITGRVVVIGGSGVGIDTALFLKDKGCEVIIVEMLCNICGELNGYLTKHLKQLILQNDIKTYSSFCVKEITDSGIIGSFNGRIEQLNCDHVVSAIGFKRRDDSTLHNAISSAGIDVEIIGAQCGSGHIMEVTRKAFVNALMD